MAFAIYRCTKLKTIGAISGSAAHNCRSRPTPNADATRTASNIQLIGFGGSIPQPSEFVNEWQCRTAGAKRKRDAVLLQELFLGTSPEFYVSADSPESRAALLEKWQVRAVRWLQEQFGDLVLGATLHIDETTPHIAAYVLPLQKAKDGTTWLSAKKLFNPLTITKQQDTYAAALAELGLARGIAGSRAKHSSLRSFYAQVEQPPVAVRNLVEACESLELQIPEKELFESGEKYQTRVREAVRRQTATIVDVARKVEGTTKTVEKDRRVAQAATSTSTALAKQNSDLREIASQVRDIPLPEVLQRLGFGDPAREGSALTWRTGEHVLNVTGSKWYDHKAGVGGGKAIDLVKHLMRCDFSEAVGWLSGQWSIAQATAAVRAAADLQVREAPRKDFSALWRYYAEKNEAATVAACEYLVRVRGLDRALIAQEIRQGRVHGSLQHFRDGGERTWCVFSHRTADGRVLGASLRATDAEEGQRRCIGDKTTAFFAVGPALDVAAALVLVESPIDALSYLQRSPRAHVVSVGGSSIPDAVVDVIKATELPVAVALDNDPAGRQGWLALLDKLRAFGEAILRRVSRVLPEVPGWPCKDWNDVLRAEVVERTAAPLAKPDMPPLLQPRRSRRGARGKFLPPLCP